MQAKFNLSTTYNGISNISFYIDEPDNCPICKTSIKPIQQYSRIFDRQDTHEKILSITFFCNKCYNSFIAQYSKEYNNTTPYKFSNLDFLAPNKIENKQFDKFISDLSPTFIKIYNQSLEAEHYGLDEIAGIGYRKSLEFLIKDFLIIHEHKDENKVKSTALGCCIDTMVDNNQLKIAASRATWLGNDQTHYEQKYTNNDINDLKRLINLSVHWISMIYLTDEAELIEKK